MPDKKALDLLPDFVLMEPDNFPHQSPGPVPAHGAGQFFPGGKTNLEGPDPGRPMKDGDRLPPQVVTVAVETLEGIGFLDNPLSRKGKGGFIHRFN